MPCSVHLHVDDADAMFEAAVAAGAVVERAPEDQLYGERSATIRERGRHAATLLDRPVPACVAPNRARGGGRLAGCGGGLRFYDQAHLIHEFRRYAGSTPTAYLAKRGARLNHPLP